MDKLKAVNTTLEAMGEFPVSSLDSGLPIASIAENKIDELASDQMAEGWWFNMEETTLKPDDNGEINIGADTLSVIPRYDEHNRLVVRGSKLYDVKNQTTEINQDVDALVHKDLDWADLPRVFQKFLAHDAGVRLQSVYLGSERVDSFNRRERNDAWEALKAEHLDRMKYNTNTGTLDMMMTTNHLIPGAW